jgi:hypothetical protein
MKRSLLVIGVLIASTSIAFGLRRGGFQKRSSDANDEAVLKQLIYEWADAAKHRDLQKLDKFEDDNFGGSAEGISFTKKQLHDAIRSRDVSVDDWKCSDVKADVDGKSGVVRGRCVLLKATYLLNGKRNDFSGVWEFEDRFVKKNGIWRAVFSKSKRIKQ